MEISQSSIQALLKKIKEGMFLDDKLMDHDPYSFIAPSAYDTAWLAMAPDASKPFRPMFKNCLDWVLNNQKEEGFWGEYDGHGMPTVECLPATIACIIALKRWNAGKTLLDKGVAFVQENAEKLLGETYDSCPRWFAIVFPAMLELANVYDVEIIFPDSKMRVTDICYKRQQILEREELVDWCNYPPLLSYLEALPLYSVDEENIVKHLSDDGSLFQSPSATACAFMATGNKDCLNYLQSLVEKCSNGVPATYPIDEELIKLCIVNQLQRLGLAGHFNQEIEGVLEQVYRNYMNQASWSKPIINSVASQLYKDSLAFWLLRMHGYNVSPWRFCWFLHDREIKELVENNHEHFSSVMLNVYRATDLMFPAENEVEEARSFSIKLLEKTDPNTNPVFPNFQTMIEHELRFPWIARLDHLEHRMWIEEKNITALWMGKTSFHRLSSLHNEKLMQLAVQNYEFRQSIYRSELEELTRWSRNWGLADMGFGREKTVYCYFAVAAVTSLPQNSEVRMIVAKSAIIITVADDFYDMEGSLDDLKKLTDAIQRWDAKGLSGHGKTIFAVLENLVSEMAAKHLLRQGSDITDDLRYIWCETFSSWFMEAKWSRSGCIPSTEEYLENATKSIATHTVVLPASCFLNPSLPNGKLRPARYESITKLLMVMSRLLNDIQSYEKEEKDGKSNFVLLHLKENAETNIEDSIAYVREMIDEKKGEMLQHALMDGLDDLPKSIRHLHLQCLKVFEMFFESTNRYDSSTEMLQDIQKAIYIPIRIGAPKPAKPLPLPQPQPQPQPQPLPPPLPLPLPLHSGSLKSQQIVANYQLHRHAKPYSISIAASSVPLLNSRNRNTNMPMSPKFKLCAM